MPRFFHARTIATIVVTFLATTSIDAQAAPETARTPDKPAAVISLGDSYISGEAGRWRGNALNDDGDKWGTDLATRCTASGCTTDPRWVYNDTHTSTNMCHRSVSAEVISAGIAGTKAVNLACSGATTKDVLQGDSERGQPNQLELLKTAARSYQVKMVVLSIGGNDLKFKDIIADCVLGYILPIGSYKCQPKWDKTVTDYLAQLRTDVGATIQATRKILDDTQGKGSYQFVLQSYPSPLPAAKDFRIAEDGPRFSDGGCPVWNSDADWARTSLVSTISTTLRTVAAAQSVRFLDVQNSFDGREVCAKAARQAQQGESAAKPVPGNQSEWVRWVVTGLTAQGDLQESFHPNYYGQRALGTCLRLMYEKSTGNFECRNTPGAGTDRMTLTGI